MNDEALTADADGTADGLIQEDALPCPGCGGEWVEGVCGRCGLSRSEAVGLLWEQTADAYAAARSAALSGRFRNARQLLQPFLSGGLETEYLRKLDALCASVLGEHQPMESPGALVLAQSDYTAAYRAADSGDFGVAVLLAERCVESAPCLLPAQKLCILALAGAGRTDAADLRRSRLAALLPQEPDITRWALAASPSLVPSPKKLARQGKPLRRRLVSPMSKATPMSKAAVPQRRPQWRGGGILVAVASLLLAAVSLTISLWCVRGYVGNRETFAKVPVSTHPAYPLPALAGTSSPVAASDKKSDRLPNSFHQELEDRYRTAEFSQARHWFNRAVQAKNAGNWRDCDRLAAAAYHLGKNTYLGDESLVLRALAADNRGESLTVRASRYASIAESMPDSVYAPWALTRAAALADQMGRGDKANQYREVLDRRYKRYPRFRTERGAAKPTETKAG